MNCDNKKYNYEKMVKQEKRKEKLYDFSINAFIKIAPIALYVFIGAAIFSYILHECEPYSYYNEIRPPEHFEESYMLEEDMNDIVWIKVRNKVDGIDNVYYDAENMALLIDFDDNYGETIYAFYPYDTDDWNEARTQKDFNKWYIKHIKGRYNCSAIYNTDDIDDKDNVWQS